MNAIAFGTKRTFHGFLRPRSTHAICFGKHDDRKERVRRMAALEQYLDVLRDHLRDTARLSYPWPRPDG